MNKTYKSIFNESTGTYVAVSETAKSKTKTKGAALIASLLLGATLPITPITAVAADTPYIQGSTSGIETNGAVLLGDSVTAAAAGNAVAVGNRAQALASGSIAIGTDAYVPQVSATNNIAIGNSASATASNNIAVGSSASVSGNYSVAFGHSATVTGATAVAIGALTKASSTSSIAIGYQAEALGSGSIALGQGSAASGLVSSAIGNKSVATGNFSSAFGDGANATGEDSLAAGALSVASAESASVYGTRAEATKAGATAVGTRSKATGVNAVAIGAYTQASLANSVALGTSAITDSGTVYSKTSTNNGITFGNYAGAVASGTGYVVSVGAIGVERQIKNVASGVVSSTSTDAINGSQLYATDVALSNVANSTENILGGNAKLNSDGSITMTNIGGTGKNTIHDAIAASAASQEEVVAGTNIASVIKTTDATGVGAFTVNANGTTVSAAASGALTVVAGTPDANNVTDYVVDLSQTTKDTIDGALQEVVTQVDGVDVKTLTKTDNTANFVSGKNITLSDDGAGGIEVATKDDVTFTNVNTTNLNTTGVTNLGGTTNITGAAYYTGPITNDTHIVNKTYVDNSVTTLADTPLTFAGDTGTDVARKLGETLNIVGGNTGTLTDGNIGIEGNGTDTLTVKLASDLAGLNSVSIIGGPTINSSGIDMGDTKITNLTAGDVNSTSTDAVNGSQLYAVSEVANKGHNVTTAATGTGVVNGTAVTNVASGDTVTYTAGNNIEVTQVGKEIQIATSLTPTFTTVNTTNLNTTGVTNLGGTTNITGDAYYTGSIKDGNSIVNKDYVDNSVTTLANAPLNFAGDTGSVIAKKLNETLTISGKLAAAADATGANLRVDSADGKLNLVMAKDLTDLNSIVINGGPTINNNGINMNGGTITNLAAGVADSDAVNVSQLKEVSNVANAGWNIATDSGTASNVKPGDTVNMKGDGSVVVSNTGNDVTVGLADVVTVGKGDSAVTIDGTNGTIQAGTEVTIDGNTGVIQAGDVTINGDKGTVNGLSNTTWDANNIVKGQAATEDQLKVVADNVTAAVGAAKTEVEAGKNVFVSSKPGDKGQAVYTVATKDEVDFNKVTVGGLTIDKSNVDAAGNTIISGVGAGELSSTSTDVVNGSQLYATNQQVAKNTTDITNINTNLDKGLNFSADSGTAVNRKLGDTVAITGDKNIVTTTTANGVQIKLSDNIDMKNVNVSQSITVAEGATVNMGGNVIQNVGAGVNGTDAVNVNQVNAVAGNLNNRISNVGHIANAGVAQAIATAGLPQAYLPGKSMMAVAGGTYEGETGYAIGFSTISDNGKWIIKVTGSGNSRDKYGASLGAGYQW